MKISCHRITEDAHLTAAPAEAFLEPWKQGEGQYWIDIHAHQPQELEEWLSKLKLSELATKCCVEPTFTSRVVPLDDAVRVYDMIVSGQVESLEILHTVEAPFLNLGDSETHFQRYFKTHGWLDSDAGA